IRTLAADLEHRRDGAELRPACEQVAGERGRVIPADVRPPGGEAAHRGALARANRLLETGPGAFLVASPETRNEVLRGHRPGPEERRAPERQRVHHLLRVEQQVRLLEPLVDAFEVDLVAAVGLEAVDAEGDECGESSLELLRDRGLSQIEDELLDRAEELRAR